MKRIIILIIITYSCKNINKNIDIIAEIDGQYLYKKDIDNFFGKQKMEIEDSINKVRGIVNQWALRKIFLNKAEVNVPSDDIKNMEHLVQKYREDLIINEYQNMLVNQKFEENIGSEESTYKYYEKNKNLFKLTNSILKLNYVVVPKNFSNKKAVLDLLKKDTLEDENVYEIESLCYGITQNYSLKDSLWKSLKDIERIVAIQESDIKKGKIMEIEDQNHIWIVKINDYKKEGDIAPYDYVQNKIKNIIYNKRKLDFLKTVERDLLEKYTKNGKFKVY